MLPPGHPLTNSLLVSKLLEHCFSLEAQLVALTEELAKAKSEQKNVIRAGRTLSEIKEELLRETLSECTGDKEKAAQMMGVSLKTFYNWYNALNS